MSFNLVSQAVQLVPKDPQQLAAYTERILKDHYEDMLRISRELSMDYGLEIAKGNILGHKGFSIPGRKDSVGTTVLEDITQTGNTVLPRPAGTDIEIISSSTNDDGDPAGTGIQIVHMEYLDVNGDEQCIAVTLNGTTAVNIGTAVYDIQWIHSIASGSNSVAVGNIQVRDVASGSIIYEQINAGGNQSLTARIKIPNGKTGYIKGWQCSSVTRKIDFRLRADVDRFSRALQAGVFNFQDAMVLEQTASGWIPFDVPLKIPSGATVKISATSFTGAGDAGGMFNMIFVDD